MRRWVVNCAFTMAYASFAHVVAEELGMKPNFLGLFFNVMTGSIIAAVATRGAK